MTDSYDFKGGPPDDAENFTVMSVGLQAKKNAISGFKKLQDAIIKSDPECSAKAGIGYTWQGMMQQAAYTMVMTHQMLATTGFTYKGQEHSLEQLFDQLQQVTNSFIDSIPKENNND